MKIPKLKKIDVVLDVQVYIKGKTIEVFEMTTSISEAMNHAKYEYVDDVFARKAEAQQLIPDAALRTHG